MGSRPSIQEAFAWRAEVAPCAMCARPCRYYDGLSDGRTVCLECSTVLGLELEPGAIVHPREPQVMILEPEMVRVRNALILRELERQPIEIERLALPVDVATRLADRAEREGMPISVIITAALQFLFAVRAAPKMETEPVLPDRALGGP